MKKRIVKVEVSIDESKLVKKYSQKEITNIAESFFFHVLKSGTLNVRGIDFEPNKENVAISSAISFKMKFKK